MEEPTMHEPEWTDAELADLARPLKVLAARVVADCREFYEPLDVLLDNHHWQRLAPTWDDFCTQWIGQSQAWVLAIGDALDNETAPVGNEMVECLGAFWTQLSPEERYQFLVDIDREDRQRPRRRALPWRQKGTRGPLVEASRQGQLFAAMEEAPHSEGDDDGCGSHCDRTPPRRHGGPAVL